MGQAVMDRRRPLLVNEGEFRTDEVLREAAADLGYGIHTKVRMADALDIDRSGLSNDAYSYALRAHFDWVVTDLGTTTPEFAVEFDGDSHTAAPVRHRDALKDEVCEKLGLPLLRIDRAGYRPTIRRSVIWYLVESWRLMKSWHEAQDRGIIPLRRGLRALDVHRGAGRQRLPPFGGTWRRRAVDSLRGSGGAAPSSPG